MFMLKRRGIADRHFWLSSCVAIACHCDRKAIQSTLNDAKHGICHVCSMTFSHIVSSLRQTNFIRSCCEHLVERVSRLDVSVASGNCTACHDHCKSGPIIHQVSHLLPCNCFMAISVISWVRNKFRIATLVHKKCNIPCSCKLYMTRGSTSPINSLGNGFSATNEKFQNQWQIFTSSGRPPIMTCM